MATPIVAGALSLVIEYGVLNNKKITNKDINIALLETSKDLGRNKNSQGWGKIDIESLLKFVRNI